jgi:hypothetical protein
MQWGKTVRTWAPVYLRGCEELEPFCQVVECMAQMLHQALCKKPDDAACRAYRCAARQYYDTMLTTSPKVQFRIYEHALLVHVPLLLAMGSLLSGSSFFLEAFNKAWKSQLMHHTNKGSSPKNGSRTEATHAKQIKAGQHRLRANRANNMDLQAMKNIWALSDPRLAARAALWTGASTFSGNMAALFDL